MNDQRMEGLVPDEELYSLLSEMQLVGKESLDAARARSKQEKTSLYESVLWYDFVSDEQLGRLAADFLRLPFVNLSQVSLDDDVVREIPEIVAKKQRILAFARNEEGLSVAVEDPSNIQIIDFLRRKTGFPVKTYLATKQDMTNALVSYQKNVAQAFDDIIAENLAQASNASDGSVELPIIKIVGSLISYAYQNRASDIHIESEEDRVRVRFRIDGILHDTVSLPIELHAQIVSRVKVMAKLRTDEHQMPQDGKIRFEMDDEHLDIRVSVVPVTEGEKVVMRLLSERSRQFSLSNLGFSANDLKKITEAYRKPYGMVLSTGPTGCGKTTTLYAILKLLNNQEVNVMTIEDPVEYDIEGVNQIQVNTKTDLTFANGLRSILRQDPNIILVGEIRDKETAGIAINLAMTGHMVLSTLHTNDAATSMPRLIDMDIEPFLLSSTVNVIVAQRLVRKLHMACRASEETDVSEMKQRLGEEVFTKVFGTSVGETMRLYKGKGCDICHKTGYSGRIGVFEVMVIDDKIRAAITDRRDASAIRDIAVAQGMTTMLEDGLEKMKEGLTTFEEVLRVTKE